MKKKPSNIEYEIAVLGTYLNFSCNGDIEEYVVKSTSTLFSHIDTRKYFNSLKDVYDKYNTCDILMLVKHLTESGQDFDASLIAQLTDMSVSTIQLPIYFENLVDLAKKRNVLELLELTVNSLYEDLGTDITEVIHNTTNILESISADGTKPIESIEGLILSVMKKMVNRQEGGEEDGLTTYIHDLDRQLGKMQPGNMIVVSARPGQGKTALVCSVASNWLLRGGNIHFFSFEMSGEDLTERMISSGADIDYNIIKGKYTITNDVFDTIANFYKSIEGNVIIDGVDFIELSKFKARCMEIKKSNSTDLIIVDYIQLMRDKSKNVREQEISSISRTIKEIAMKLDIPIIALAQLSREVEKRPDKRPQLSDLRESGAIEQDADKVVFLVRPEYYGINEMEDGSDSRNKGYALVRKNRSGETGDVVLQFEGNKQRFSIYRDNKLNSYEDVNKRIERQKSVDEFPDEPF